MRNQRIVFPFILFITVCSMLMSCQQTPEISDSTFKETQEKKPQKIYGPGDVTFSAIQDKEGNLWFTSSFDGVYKFDGTVFTNYTTEDGLSHNSVNEIVEDREGNLVFGTANGACFYDGKSFTHLPMPFTDTTGVWLDKVYPIVNPNGVMSILHDQKGDYWFGTNGAGVYNYDGEKFTRFLHEAGNIQEDGMHRNVIMSIVEDDQGDIWFSSFTHGGISRYDGKIMRHYFIEDGIGDDMIMTSFKDRQGRLWFGTRAGGATVYDGETFINYSENDGLCNNNVSAFYETDSTLLMGSFSRNPMCQFDGEAFSPFGLDSPLDLVDIRVILQGPDNHLWFGGRHGLLVRYDGKNYIDYTQLKNENHP